MRSTSDDAPTRRARHSAGFTFALALAVGLAGCVGAPGASAPSDGSEGIPSSTPASPSSAASPSTGDGAGPSAGPSERPVASLPPGAATLPPSGPPVTGEVPEAVLAAILEDAAQRTGADPATATIVRAEAVTWSDGSLGCPEPGMFYIQIAINGYWVVVELGGRTLDYRVGAHGAFGLCEQPAPGAP
jgi:hypothetical protein